MKLGETSSCSFATGLELICETCDENKEKNRLEINYLNKKMKGMKIDTKKYKKSQRTVQLKRDHLQRVQTEKILPGRDDCQVRPV